MQGITVNPAAKDSINREASLALWTTPKT